jgi:hypothetical protein
VPARSLKDELLAIEPRQEELEREIARAPELQPLLHPNLAELYRQKVAQLEQALADPEEGTQAMEMIRSLIDALVLTPEGGQLRIDLTGELAAILSIAQKDQRPRPEDEARASQIELVAGGPQLTISNGGTGPSSSPCRLPPRRAGGMEDHGSPLVVEKLRRFRPRE